MHIVYEYSHLGGAEIMQVRYTAINAEVYSVINSVEARRTKQSKEKTKKGKYLYSPLDMNGQFKQEFYRPGFHELRDTYTINIPNSTIEIPGAYKQIDFVKEKVLVEAQFGKYAFMFYDLAKFQYFFNESKCDVGIEIVPSHGLHREMSSGVSYGEQLIFDIERLKRHFPALPLKVILIEA